MLADGVWSLAHASCVVTVAAPASSCIVSVCGHLHLHGPLLNRLLAQTHPRMMQYVNTIMSEGQLDKCANKPLVAPVASFV